MSRSEVNSIFTAGISDMEGPETAATSPVHESPSSSLSSSLFYKSQKHTLFNKLSKYRKDKNHLETDNQAFIEEEEEEEEEDIVTDTFSIFDKAHCLSKPLQNQDSEQENEDLELNIIDLFTECLLFLTWITDVIVPNDSKYRNLALINVVQILDVVKQVLRKTLSFYARHRLLFNIVFTVWVLSVIPPLFFTILIMAVYGSLVSMLFSLGFTIVGLLSVIGFFPIFVITLSVILVVTLNLSALYFVGSFLIRTIEPIVPVRSLLSYLADMIPPSIGIRETKPDKKPPSATDSTTNSKTTSKDSTPAVNGSSQPVKV